MLGGAATIALVGCGRSDDVVAQPQLVSLFSSDRVIAAGVEQRIPFAVVDVGDLVIDDTAEFPVRILIDGVLVEATTVVGRLVDHDHRASENPDHQHADLLRYFALRTELPEPGIYDLEVDFGSGAVGQLPFQAFDPVEVTVPLPGDPLPPIRTPTFDEPDGIDPLCTRVGGPCPFHADDVAATVGNGRPLALLVATPALCSTAYCGPVLDTLIDVAPDHPDVTFVHLEVYANAEQVGGNYDDPDLRVADPVVELGLTYEPALFLVDGEGRVVDRIDNIYDRAELDDALTALA